MGAASALPIAPVQCVYAHEDLPKPQRCPVLLTFLRPADSQALDDSSFSRVVVVTSQGIEQFCLLTGVADTRKYAERQERRLNAAIRMSVSPYGPGVLVCDDLGTFKFIDLRSLSVQTAFQQSKTASKVYMESDEISALLPLPDLHFAVGHKNGLVEVWTFGRDGADLAFNEEMRWEMPGITKLALANDLKWLLSGHESAYINRKGRFCTLESYAIRIYSLENQGNSRNCEELAGFTGTCFDLAVSEAANLVIALSSIGNQVFIWRLGANSLIFTFNLPNILRSPAIAASFLAISAASKGLLLCFGLSDGSVIVSRLATDANQRLIWTALKTIQPKSGEKWENREISLIKYEETEDILLLGDRKSQVRLVCGFIAAMPEAQMPVSPMPIEAKSQSLKANDTAFARYLASRLEAAQSSEDSLLAATQDWQLLSPEQRQSFESFPSP